MVRGCLLSLESDNNTVAARFSTVDTRKSGQQGEQLKE